MELLAGAFVGIEASSPECPAESAGEEWEESAEPRHVGDSWVMTEKRKEELRQTKTFRKIEQDIRDRNRRSKRRLKEDKKSKYNDEFYVDKSRQIATMTAEKDLKGHILRHRGHMLKSRSSAENDIMKVKTLVSQAAYELRLGTAEVYYAFRFALLSLNKNACPDRNEDRNQIVYLLKVSK